VRGLRIAIFGSSLVSTYWNGAATYYRGIVRALSERGHQVSFYEPDALDRQQHRDLGRVEWARSVVYPATAAGVLRALDDARHSELVIKASGVGVFDDVLDAGVIALQGPGTAVAYWDVDAPATLARLRSQRDDPLSGLIPNFDLVLTYGGGKPVVQEYLRIGARGCTPVYNAVDPRTHHPVESEPRFAATLSFLGNRLPDREARCREFFFRPAGRLPQETFVLGGSGWDADPRLPNVRVLGHVASADHNAFYCSPRAVINITRDDMAMIGWSPATRVFEAAGAGACLITDAWAGIEDFLEPDTEVLVAHDGAGVAELLAGLTRRRAAEVGRAALRRVLAEHTYRHRAEQLEDLFGAGLHGQRRAVSS
jgi:spore maturation protein CgeB